MKPIRHAITQSPAEPPVIGWQRPHVPCPQHLASVARSLQHTREGWRTCAATSDRTEADCIFRVPCAVKLTAAAGRVMAVIAGGIRVGIGLAAGQAADGASRGNRLHNTTNQAEVLDVGMMARETPQPQS